MYHLLLRNETEANSRIVVRAFYITIVILSHHFKLCLAAQGHQTYVVPKQQLNNNDDYLGRREKNATLEVQGAT